MRRGSTALAALAVVALAGCGVSVSADGAQLSPSPVPAATARPTPTATSPTPRTTAPSRSPSPTSASPRTSTRPTGEPSPSTPVPPGGAVDLPTEDAFVSCLKFGATTSTVESVDPPAGGAYAVTIDTPDSSLPKGYNRVGAIAFDDPAIAELYYQTGQEYAANNGGTAKLFGSVVVITQQLGRDDDRIVAAVDACLSS